MEISLVFCWFACAWELQQKKKTLNVALWMLMMQWVGSLVNSATNTLHHQLRNIPGSNWLFSIIRRRRRRTKIGHQEKLDVSQLAFVRRRSIQVCKIGATNHKLPCCWTAVICGFEVVLSCCGVRVFLCIGKWFVVVFFSGINWYVFPVYRMTSFQSTRKRPGRCVVAWNGYWPERRFGQQPVVWEGYTSWSVGKVPSPVISQSYTGRESAVGIFSPALRHAPLFRIVVLRKAVALKI